MVLWQHCCAARQQCKALALPINWCHYRACSKAVTVQTRSGLHCCMTGISAAAASTSTVFCNKALRPVNQGGRASTARGVRSVEAAAFVALTPCQRQRDTLGWWTCQSLRSAGSCATLRLTLCSTSTSSKMCQPYAASAGSCGRLWMRRSHAPIAIPMWTLLNCAARPVVAQVGAGNLQSRYFRCQRVQHECAHFQATIALGCLRAGLSTVVLQEMRPDMVAAVLDALAALPHLRELDMPRVLLVLRVHLPCNYSDIKGPVMRPGMPRPAPRGHLQQSSQHCSTYPGNVHRLFVIMLSTSLAGCSMTCSWRTGLGSAT